MVDIAPYKIVAYADEIQDEPTVTFQYGDKDYIIYKSDLFPDRINLDPITNMYTVLTIDGLDSLDFHLGEDLTSYSATNGFVDCAKSLFNSNLYTVTINSVVIHDMYITSYGRFIR